jgi:hypothetical protein
LNWAFDVITIFPTLIIDITNYLFIAVA